MIAGNMNELPLAGVAPSASAKSSSNASNRSGSGFDEALAGASTVLDRQQSKSISARDRSQAADKSSGATAADDAQKPQDSAGTSGADATTATDQTREASETDQHGTAEGEGEAAPTETDGTDVASETAGTEVRAEVVVTVQVDAPVVAVSAAPVVEATDAVIQPTLPQATSTSTQAVDAAIRLAIGETEVHQQAPTSPEVEVASEAAVEVKTAQTTIATTDVSEVQTAAGDSETAVETGQVAKTAQTVQTTVRGAEGAHEGDAATSAKSSTTIDAPAASGPSLVQQETPEVQQVEAPKEAETTAPTVQKAVTVQTEATDEVADGETAQTAQQTAAVVDAAGDEPEAPAEDDDAVRIRTAALPTTTAKTDETSKAAVTVEEGSVDTDAPVVQARTTTNAPAQPAVQQTTGAQQQVRAEVQGEAQAEAADGDAAPAVKGDGSTQQPLQAPRAEQTNFGQRVRDAVHANGMRERIDNIANQLATRLRLSHAAGGSQVQLSLRPRELGEVTVQMNVREGVVAATVMVERKDTLQLMQTNIDDLKRSLENQGLTIQQFDVDVRDGGDTRSMGADARQGGSRARTPDGSSLAGAAGVIPGLSGDREVTVEDHHDGDVSLLA